MQIVKRSLRAALMCVLIALAVRPAPASQVRQINLEEMTRSAGTIFSGRCIDVHSERDATVGREVIVARFAVDRAEKGAPGGEITVRMLDVAAIEGAPESAAGARLGFTPGEPVVLFLYKSSAIGLTSPVGFGQGRFRLLRDKTGRELAFNGFGNQKLLERLSPAAESRLHLAGVDRHAPVIGTSQLLDMVRTLHALQTGSAR